MTRIEIDLNVRCDGNLTRAGFEDIDGPFNIDDEVTVFEPESGLFGTGTIRSIDFNKELVLIEVFWNKMTEASVPD